MGTRFQEVFSRSKSQCLEVEVEMMKEASIFLVNDHGTERFPRRHHIHLVRVKASNCGGLFGLALDSTQQELPTIIAPVG